MAFEPALAFDGNPCRRHNDLPENSDGVVPLSSQLHPEAQEQANQTFGFDSGHVDILADEQRARESKQSPVWIKGVGHAAELHYLGDRDLSNPVALAEAAKRACQYHAWHEPAICWRCVA